MLINLLAAVLAAAPLALVLMVGLGAAGWLYTRFPPAGIALGLGIGAVGLSLVLGVGADTLLMFGPSFGVDLTGLGTAMWLAIGTVHGLGVVGMLVAACLGPAGEAA